MTDAHGAASWSPRTIRASPASAASSARPASTSCRSSSTWCSRATCRWSARGRTPSTPRPRTGLRRGGRRLFRPPPRQARHHRLGADQRLARRDRHAREDPAPRRARPLLHRELVGAVRPLHPGADAARAAQDRERLLMIARTHAPRSSPRWRRAPRRACGFPPRAALPAAVADRRLRRHRVHRAEPLRGGRRSSPSSCSSSAG